MVRAHLDPFRHPHHTFEEPPPEVSDEGGNHQPEMPRNLVWCGGGSFHVGFVDLGATFGTGSVGTQRIGSAVHVARITPGHTSKTSCQRSFYVGAHTRRRTSTATSSVIGPAAKSRAASTKVFVNTSGDDVGSRRIMLATPSSPNSMCPLRASASPSV